MFLGHSQAYSLKSGVHLFFIFMHNSQTKYQMAVFYYTRLQSVGFFPMRKTFIIRAGTKQRDETINNS